MTQFAPGRKNGHDGRTDADTDLDARDARALTEYMTVLPEGGDIYTVVGQNGGTYTVDAREGRCTCPDAQYNLDDDEQCKHERRVAFATGARAVPAWVDTDAVDGQLGLHCEGDVHTTREEPVVRADGGEIIEASDEGEVLDEESDDSDDGRPDDCDCAPSLGDLPCWPCYREGFDAPNPSTEE